MIGGPRFNVTVRCAGCNRRIEVVLGLPMTDEDPPRLLTTSLGYQDHCAKSPSCALADPGITYEIDEATPEGYGMMKPTLPGVPRLMLYPPEET